MQRYNIAEKFLHGFVSNLIFCRKGSLSNLKNDDFFPIIEDQGIYYLQRLSSYRFCVKHVPIYKRSDLILE